MVLGQARITDEGVAQLKTRVGSYFKGEYIFAHNHMMTKGGIAHWCDGIGDFKNKLYRDEEYAAKTQIRLDYRASLLPEQHPECQRDESGRPARGTFFPLGLGLALAETGQSQ